MEGEEASNLMIDAIKYGFTNLAALLIGGVIFGIYVLVYLLMFLVPFVTGYYGQEKWTIPLIAVLAIPSIVLMFYLIGYMVRCMRSVIRGNEVLPSALADIAGTFKLGIMGLLIYLPYIIIMLLVLLVIILPILLMPENVVIALFFSAALLAVSVVLAIFGFIFMLLIVNYAATGNFIESLNPMTAVRLLLKNPIDFVISLVIYYVITLVLSLAAITVVLYPWVFFLTVTSLSFIMGKYYRRVTGPAPGA
jgi:hypothetical protein